MKIKSILLSIVIIFLYSCATGPKSLYYYGKYSHTLYEYKKSLSEEQLQTHINELHKIIYTSNKRKLRIPPGIYAELGFYYSKKSDFENAIKYYKMESETYPESQKFMKTLIDNIRNNSKGN